MVKTIAINGFGRIGRMLLRTLIDDSSCGDIQVVAINDLMDIKTLAHLFKYDSVHGINKFTVDFDNKNLIIKGKSIRVLAENDPVNLPWGDLKVDVVIESTGVFANRKSAEKHLQAGSKKVVISAPANDSDITLVLGVNEDKYDAIKHKILSNASCTTNCVAPVAKVLHDSFGIKRGLMTTVHSYTNDQGILDVPHKDPRRGRAANLSMIPTSTGAAKAVGVVLPELCGKIDGLAIRVPTPNVSLVDLVAELDTEANLNKINKSFKDASIGPLKDILRFEEEPLVSVDFNGNDASSIVDGLSTKIIENRMVKVLAWYDNEWGYANRIKDLIKFIYQKGI